MLTRVGLHTGLAEYACVNRTPPSASRSAIQITSGSQQGLDLCGKLLLDEGDVVVQIDADLEYRPEDIPAVVAALDTTDAVYGSRFLGTIEGMRLPNRVANHILAFLVSALYGQRITDEATAYKAFRRDILQSIPLTCRRFEFCPEVTAKLLQRHIAIYEVPISYYPRSWDEGKKIKAYDGLIAVWTLLKYRLFYRRHGPSIPLLSNYRGASAAAARSSSHAGLQCA